MILKLKSGEKLELQDGSTHQLEDYNEISEVADITAGGFSLEMVAASYDDRSIRAQVHRTAHENCFQLSTLHASLSTSLALEYDTTQNKAPDSDHQRDAAKAEDVLDRQSKTKNKEV
ncbi:tetratricopeptide repeat (TPR)-containing protein [Euphorbia peplus]|nr:tetratricopeptide repeat (TPR)-containing protein [Euphorbia peplus]